MRIFTSLAQQTPKAVVEHNGQTVEFQVSVFGKGTMISDDADDPMELNNDVFHYLNSYWADLPLEQQQSLFDVYFKLKEVLSMMYTVADMNENLAQISAELMSFHDLDKVQSWISFRSGIVIPEVFSVDYIPNTDNNSTREKTYTRLDYVQLVTLSLALRCMIPVWGEYISATRRSVGNYYKEFWAYLLLKYSNAYNSPAIDKLRTYIENNLDADKDNSEKLMNVLPTADYPQWLLSLAVVKKLCIGDISGNNQKDPSFHLIKYLYKFLMQRIRSPDADHVNKIQKNRVEDVGRDNKSTVLERYRMKTSISPGEVVELECTVENLENVASRLTTKLTEEMFRSAQNSCTLLEHQQLSEVQITILSWVFKPVISPKGISYLDRSAIVKLLGVLQSVLWARGHKYLALLVTSYPRISNEEYVLAPQSSKDRVPKELSDEIEKIYPFSKPIGRVSTGKTSNYVLESIDTVVNQLVSNSWLSTADDRLLKEVFGNTSRFFIIKSDIRTDLAKLIIEIGNRNWV
jgi:hypothetical protein